MFRILLATVAGAVVIYVWLFSAWMVLGLHDESLQSLPAPADVTSALKSKDLSTGAYHVPAWPDDVDDAEAAMEKFTEQHEAGPIYTLYYHKEGKPVLGARTFIGAVILDLLSAAIVAIALWCAAPRLPIYFCRVGFVAMLGVFVALMGHVSYLVWMSFPVDYTIAMCIDQVVGWLLAGLVMGAIITSPKTSTQEKAQEHGA